MLFIDIILPVFLIVAAGYFFEKKSRPDFRPLTDISLYIFSPALVLSALVKQDISLSLTGDILLFMILYTAGMALFSFLAARAMSFGPEQKRALSLTTVFMNVGNFGLPLSWFAFGEAGLNISIMTFVLFNIPLGSLAIIIAQGKGTALKSALANMAKIPIFHAVLVALAIKGLGIELPLVLLRPLELLGQAAIPVMLVLLGMQLAKTKLQGSMAFLSLSTVLRLLIAPALGWALTTALGMKGLVQAVVILQTSTPSAVLPLLYSLRFETRPDLVAGAILVTTAASAVTLTVLLYLLQA
ncbi:MAG: AEC family transporter [Desulfuromonadales bacterium]